MQLRKCKTVRIGNFVPVTYTVASLETVDQEKDLCVQCGSNLYSAIKLQPMPHKYLV